MLTCPVCFGTGKSYTCLTTFPPQWKEDTCHFCNGLGAVGEILPQPPRQKIEEITQKEDD